ncbi:ribonuclease III [Allofranklinella schreckenbergeri]|uniref:ribonuclease III n=1 Tax=Allofranklinella schreckenbergeri TaxID=1076744 RepID=UPI0036F4A82D
MSALLLSSLREVLPQLNVASARLKQACTHRSYSSTHNERLEFLGDAVLNLCISHWLMERLPRASEGELSRTRANLVCEQSLHGIALRLGLQDALLMGEGERKTEGHLRPSTLADAFEALIGAIYLEGGLVWAQQWVAHCFRDVDLSSTAQVKAKDAKTQLQEWLQARRMALPEYELQEVQGQDHQQIFVVLCRVSSVKLSATGKGVSRKAAEQQAAAGVLKALELEGRSHRMKGKGKKK